MKISTQNALIDKPGLAIELAKLVLESTQGRERLEKQLPFSAEDRDDMWLVTGQGETDPDESQLAYSRFYMHVVKQDAEIVNVGIRGVMHAPKAYISQIRASVTEAQFEAMYGEPVKFSKEDRNIHFSELIYGGVINQPEAAVRFAALLFGQETRRRSEERDGVWHVYENDEPKPILRFRRSNAQVLF